MKEECLICQAPLEYLTQDEAMTCAICGKTEPSKTRCVKGHYVCSDCTLRGWTPSSVSASGRPPGTPSPSSKR